MKTKVKSVTASGSFNSQQYGEMFKFKYEFEDGVTMVANHKTNSSPYPAGTEVEYEVKKDDPTYGKQGTVGKPKDQQQGSGGGGFKAQPKDQDAILYQTCLKCATELHAAKAMQMPTAEELSAYAFRLAGIAKVNIVLLKVNG